MDATKKDLVLRKIQEHKAITRGALAGTTRLKKEEVESIAKTLEAEGKIKAWPGKRSDSLVYTTPDLPNPLEEIDGKKPAAKKKAAPRASGPAGPRKSQAIPRNPIPAQVPVKVPPKNGGGQRGGLPERSSLLSADPELQPLTYDGNGPWRSGGDRRCPRGDCLCCARLAA